MKDFDIMSEIFLALSKINYKMIAKTACGIMLVVIAFMAFDVTTALESDVITWREAIEPTVDIVAMSVLWYILIRYAYGKAEY